MSKNKRATDQLVTHEEFRGFKTLITNEFEHINKSIQSLADMSKMHAEVPKPIEFKNIAYTVMFVITLLGAMTTFVNLTVSSSKVGTNKDIIANAKQISALAISIKDYRKEQNIKIEEKQEDVLNILETYKVDQDKRREQVFKELTNMRLKINEYSSDIKLIEHKVKNAKEAKDICAEKMARIQDRLMLIRKKPKK